VSLRPIRDSDAAFLRNLYGSTRAEEMALAGFDDAQQAVFIDMQFRAQHADYTKRYPDASFDVILWGDEAVGRLYVARRADELRILDVTIAPAHRGLGIGGNLLSRLIEEARRAELPLRIHLDSRDRSAHLFQRLGFTCKEREETHSLFEWRP
jgi:GNAT superfamily N-acetyltransferase